MRICILTDEKTAYAPQSFLKVARERKIAISFFRWKDIYFDNTKKDFFLIKNIPLKKFDAIILRSPIKSIIPASVIADFCEKNKIRLLNMTFYLRYQIIHKIRQQALFQLNDLPCLETIFNDDPSFSFLKKSLGLPFVAKSANGSLGRQVFKINKRVEFIKFINQQKKGGSSFLFQKFYQIDGDYRVFIIGKKVFGPLKRIAPEGEWKTNIRKSRHERAEDKKQVLSLAKLFYKKTGIEFAGLDILIDSRGKARLIEINTMACFRVFDNVFPEINIAQEIIALLKKTSN